MDKEKKSVKLVKKIYKNEQIVGSTQPMKKRFGFALINFTGKFCTMLT